jgi:hypothetical protein
MIEFAGTDIVLETPTPLEHIRSAVSAALGVPDSRVAVIEDVAHYPEPDSADVVGVVSSVDGEFAQLLSLQLQPMTVPYDTPLGPPQRIVDLLETRALVPADENNPYTMWLLAPLSPPHSALLDVDAVDDERYVLSHPGRTLDAGRPSTSGPEAIIEVISTAPGAARDRLRLIDDGAVLVDALRIATSVIARQILCDVLGLRREPSAIDALIDALTSSSPKVRSAAADALAKIADRRAGPALLARLQLPDPDPGVRRMLAASLGAVHHCEAIPILTSLLTDPDASLRGSAAWSLGALGATEALPQLETALHAEQAPYAAQRMQEAIVALASASYA